MLWDGYLIIYDVISETKKSSNKKLDEYTKDEKRRDELICQVIDLARRNL